MGLSSVRKRGTKVYTGVGSDRVKIMRKPRSPLSCSTSLKWMRAQLAKEIFTGAFEKLEEPINRLSRMQHLGI